MLMKVAKPSLYTKRDGDGRISLLRSLHLSPANRAQRVKRVCACATALARLPSSRKVLGVFFSVTLELLQQAPRCLTGLPRQPVLLPGEVPRSLKAECGSA